MSNTDRPSPASQLWLNEAELRQIEEIRRHLADLHYLWQNDPEDCGHCKRSEGAISIIADFPNWFDAERDSDKYLNAKPTIRVTVYSYLFGPHRLHEFSSVAEAHQAVLSWEYGSQWTEVPR